MIRPALSEILQKASADDYKIELFSKEIDGQTRLLVLAGEVHLKSPESAAIGRALVIQFNSIGIESYDPKRTWGGELTAPLAKIRGPRYWLRKKVFGSLDGRSEGSTVDEAVLAEVRLKYFKRLELLQTEQPEQFAELLSTLEGSDKEILDREIRLGAYKIFDGHGYLAMLRAIAGGQAAGSPNPTKTFLLEEGHVPKFRENLASLDSLVLKAATIAYFGTTFFLPIHLQILDSAIYGAYFLHSRANLLVLQLGQHGPILNRLFPLAFADIDGRDETMTRNLNRALEASVDAREFLAVVGQAHIPGMKRLLLESGYRSLTAP